MSHAIRIQAEDFDLTQESDLLSRSGAGAVVTFTGHVRGEGGVTSLTLEHYPGMTEREIARHVTAAERRWPLLGVTIIHRVGELKPGDRIVLVGVASRHRGAAFAACEFLMDYLKNHAPFWKEEHQGDAVHWVEAKTTDDDALKRWNKP